MSAAEIDWKQQYDALLEDARDTCASVHSILTEEAWPMGDQERLATAANELLYTVQRLDQREVFDAAGLGEGTSDA